MPTARTDTTLGWVVSLPDNSDWLGAHALPTARPAMHARTSAHMTGQIGPVKAGSQPARARSGSHALDVYGLAMPCRHALSTTDKGRHSIESSAKYFMCMHSTRVHSQPQFTIGTPLASQPQVLLETTIARARGMHACMHTNHTHLT